MKFARLLILLFLFHLPAQPTYDELREKVRQFVPAHNRFSRNLFGCPETGELMPGSCDFNRATIDYDAYSRARKAAAKLYALKLE